MSSNLSLAESFIRVSVTGVGPMLDTLDTLLGTFGKQDALVKILEDAAKPIRDEYKSRALTHDATGNLAKSTTIKTKKYPSGNAVAIAGPRHTGTAGATGKMASGNHSWLVEFGSDGPRRPSTRNKKTYVSVHKMINRKMTVHAVLEDSEKFAKRSRGYYFLMSSWKEPTRQPRAGKGYTHDFLPIAGGRRRVFTLHPGETYGAMPGYHLMENTIKAKASTVQGILRSGIIEAINEAVEGSL
jgi:hypothetical protein